MLLMLLMKYRSFNAVNVVDEIPKFFFNWYETFEVSDLICMKLRN